jgi:hypothetical protein
VIHSIALLMLSGAFGGPEATPPAPVAYRLYRDAFLTIEIPRGASQTTPETFRFLRGGEWTEFEVTFSTPHSDEREVDCGRHPASYRVSRPNLFAYSCLVDGRIKYHVEKYGRTYRVGPTDATASDATETIEFTITYPASQRNFWDPVVSHMSSTLRFPAARRRV